MAERIDVHKVNDSYDAALSRLDSDSAVLPRNRELLTSFLHDCGMGKTIKHSQKKRIGTARCLKYLHALKQLSLWIDKAFDEVEMRDMETLIGKLDRGYYKTKQNQPYSEETRADFKKALKKFYKWLQGDNERYPELVSWIETFVKPNEIPALSREEVEKMIEWCGSIRDRAIIRILFDSGARAEEFLNIRLLHLTRKNDYYMIRIEHSKTKPRSISLPLSTREIEAWLSIHPHKENPESQLFPIQYAALRKMIARAGKKSLGKPVHPHLLRHSSATYYCTKLTSYQLCYRFGWSMTSGQPARYIDREGLRDQDTVKAVKAESLHGLKTENENIREEMIRLKERMERSEARNRLMDKLMNALMKQPEDIAKLAKAVSENGLKTEFDSQFDLP